MHEKPSFLITIDTEGDDLWSRPRTVTTRNAAYLPRFQELCEAYDLRPTYLANYEMANSSTFQEFARQMLDRNTGEVGMHLHAWDTPPDFKLTNDDTRHHPYLIEYPERVMRQKVRIMTDCLENAFGVKMLSHRAGRWGIDERYARILIEHGYTVDCTVTPYLSWKQHAGDPAQAGGPDYTHFPDSAYFMNLGDISRPGASSLLEIPVSIKVRPAAVNGALANRVELAKRILNRLFPRVWLRPDGNNLDEMLRYLRYAIRTKRDYVVFVLHSSEFMPGGSPTFRSHAAIEQLYSDLEVLFDKACQSFAGRTLSEYHERHTRNISTMGCVNVCR